MVDIDNIDDVGILARTLWGEARGEGEIGMKAVACVIMNRANDPKWWGDTPRKVCLKEFQFGCWNANDPNHQKMLDVSESNAAFLVAENIATLAIAGNLQDITNNANSYYAASSPIPKWAVGVTPCATIGHHIFFHV